MKTKKFISYIFILSVLYSCESEKVDIPYYGQIIGVVLDGETYLPVQGAMITTTPASISLLSDAEGNFIIQKIKEGEVAISIKKKNYMSNSLSVAVYEDEITHLDILIFKDNNDIGKISVYDPVPGNGAVEQNQALTLKWKIDGKKSGTILTYNVYIFESNSTVQQLLGEDIEIEEVTTSSLKLGTTYYWYVVVKYDGNKVAYSPTWSFKTKDN